MVAEDGTIERLRSRTTPKVRWAHTGRAVPPDPQAQYGVRTSARDSRLLRTFHPSCCSRRPQTPEPTSCGRTGRHVRSARGPGPALARSFVPAESGGAIGAELGTPRPAGAAISVRLFRKPNSRANTPRVPAVVDAVFGRTGVHGHRGTPVRVNEALALNGTRRRALRPYAPSVLGELADEIEPSTGLERRADPRSSVATGARMHATGWSALPVPDVDDHKIGVGVVITDVSS